MRFIFSPKTILFGVVGGLVISCTQYKSEESYKAPETIADTSAFLPDETPASSLKRKFIRTAELKFQVNDVRKASEQIEALTANYGGFITQSSLQTNRLDQKTIQVSIDSLMEVSSINIVSDITIRIPNEHLESLLKDLNGMIQYLDYRNIKADDVSLQLLSNSIASKRLENFSRHNQQANGKRKGNILAATEAEEKMLEHQLQADSHKIDNLSLQDKIDYSTIVLNLYQKESLHKIMLQNRQSIHYYKANFFLRVWDSIKIGWDFLEETIVILIRLWFILIPGAIILFYWLTKSKRAK
ncbi:DUF4349 domain-containing protein [Emticicia sp. 17c]|uniref:DUF4349 domain-containing protein n=1 Tax=Emticicia sp. 17c TaxID=3127704 RepID=UPI00301D2232